MKKNLIKHIFYLIFSVVFLISSCRTSKKTKEIEQQKLDVKVDYQHKIDSVISMLSYIQVAKLSQKDTMSLKTEFEISFKKKDSGVINFETPQGIFKAEKSGDGNLRILGQIKNSQIKENKENLTTQKDVKRTTLNEQKNAQVQINANKKKTTHEVKKTGNWFVRLWWLWLIIIAEAWVFWKMESS